MVSGLVTSPWLQLRIFSGEAREMRIESKSAIKFARSYGEDLKIASRKRRSQESGDRSQNLRLPVAARLLTRSCAFLVLKLLATKGATSPEILTPDSWLLTSAQSIRRQGRIRHFARLLHQLDVETQRLQLANQYVEGFR